MSTAFLLFALSVTVIMSAATASISGTSSDVVAAHAGESAKLRCRFQGTTNQGIRLTWERADGLSIANVTECTGMSVTRCTISVSDMDKYEVTGSLNEGVDLVVGNIELQDDGEYECLVISTAGLGKNKVRLAVSYPPKRVDIYVGGINVTNGIAHLPLNKGRNVTCEIKSPSNPPANITLETGGIEDVVREPEHSKVPENPFLSTSSRAVTLYAQGQDRDKNLSCVATHYNLTFRANATVDVGPSPKRPNNVEISAASPTTLLATWQAGDTGSPFPRYQVQLCPMLGGNACQTISNITSTRYRLVDLQPFTLYSIKVSAHTVYGYSDESAAANTYTNPLSPDEMGILAVYDPGKGVLVVKARDNTTRQLPPGLCVQLSSTTAGTGVAAAYSNCVGIGEELPVPPGTSWTDALVVTCGNNVCSATSKPVSEKSGSKLGLIVGLSVGIGVAFIAMVAVIVCVRKQSGGAAHGGRTSSRSNPPPPVEKRPPLSKPPEIYRESAKYHDIMCDYEETDNTLYTVHPRAPEHPDKGGGSGAQYYSRQIQMTSAQTGVPAVYGNKRKH
ncbi:uncharacterized protein [Diadema antillarum]|uniref:uncharacterized protein isoform X1 n=1 Tax=Diadema antillarum TaxID=105358 RepID=UPI003A85F8B9